METVFELIYNTRVLLRTDKFGKCLKQAKFLYSKKNYKHMKFTIKEITNGLVTFHDVNEEYLKDKKWEELSLTAKQRAIFNFTQLSKYAFWKFCGKDRQNHYQYMIIDENNVDKVRDAVFSEYITALDKTDVLDKDIKIAKAKKLLF